MSTTTAKRHHNYYIQALAIARGDPASAAAYMQARPDLLAQRPVLKHLDLIEKTDPHTADFIASDVAASFLAAVAQRSVAGRLTAMHRVPLRTRLFVAPRNGAVLASIPEAAEIPVIASEYDEIILEGIKIAAISVQTLEAASSPSPLTTVFIDDELTSGIARAENRAFVGPNVTGSLLDGAPSFVAGGASVANIDEALLTLVDLVPGAGDPNSGAWLMSATTAARLALKRGADGALAYPQAEVNGGSLLGLPILPTEELDEQGSPMLRHVALVAAGEIFFAEDDGIQIDVSQNAALQMSEAPSAGAQSLLSLYQGNLYATRAIKRFGWHARSGAAAVATMTDL